MSEDLQTEIKAVFDGILGQRRKFIQENTAEVVEKESWYFTYDPTMSVEWNLYMFTSALESFKRTMRDWETHHNGNLCVVERVRDAYIMPRIKQFIKDSKHE